MNIFGSLQQTLQLYDDTKNNYNHNYDQFNQNKKRKWVLCSDAISEPRPKSLPQPQPQPQPQVQVTLPPLSTSSTSLIAKNSNTLTWMEKYRVHQIKDLVGNKKARDSFNQWLIKIKQWSPQPSNCTPPPPPVCILYGSAGCGKTSSAYSYLTMHGYGIDEVNMSLDKDYKSVKKKLTECMYGNQMVSPYLPRALLLEELDGVTMNDEKKTVSYRSGLTAVSDFLTQYFIKQQPDCTFHPIVCTCNEIHSDKLKQFIQKYKDYIIVIKFGTLYTSDLKQVLERVCLKEHYTIPKHVQYNILDLANGDARKLLNILQWMHVKPMSYSLQQQQQQTNHHYPNVFQECNQLFQYKPNHSFTCNNNTNEEEEDYAVIDKMLYYLIAENRLSYPFHTSSTGNELLELEQWTHYMSDFFYLDQLNSFTFQDIIQYLFVHIIHVFPLPLAAITSNLTINKFSMFSDTNKNIIPVPTNLTSTTCINKRDMFELQLVKKIQKL